MNALSEKDLLGKRVDAAGMADEGLYLRIDGVLHVMGAYGDCCANAYFAHVDGSDALRDATVLAVEDLECSSVETQYDQTDTWGHRIITTKGTCTLDMRTEHNGYYSGWMTAPKPVDAMPANANPLRDF